MSNAQWTVVGLLVFILALEALRVPQVRTFFSALYQNFNTQTGKK